jgi:hypothetical protein
MHHAFPAGKFSFPAAYEAQLRLKKQKNLDMHLAIYYVPNRIRLRESRENRERTRHCKS